MNQFIADVSHIPGGKTGNPAMLIGSDGTQAITMEELGDLSGRFNYEFVCSPGKRIPGVYS